METKKRMKNSKCYYPCLTLWKVRPWKPMTALLMELCQIMKANHQSFKNKFPKLFCLTNLRSCFLDTAVSGIPQWNEPVAKKVTQARKGHKLDINSVSLATEFSLVSKLLQKMIPKKKCQPRPGWACDKSSVMLSFLCLCTKMEDSWVDSMIIQSVL